MRLRQSYVRIAKRAAMMAGRYAHAKQFNRHRRQLRILRTRLGRLIRDIRRKIAGNAELEAVFAWPLSRADQIPLAAAAPARLEAVFLPRSGGGVHRQGKARGSSTGPCPSTAWRRRSAIISWRCRRAALLPRLSPTQGISTPPAPSMAAFGWWRWRQKKIRQETPAAKTAGRDFF